MSDISKCLFGGYDCKQVDEKISYLNQLIECQKQQISELEEKLSKSLEENAKLEQRVKEQNDVKDAIQESLNSAKKISDSMIASTTKLCDEKLQDTEMQSQKMIEEKTKTLDMIRKDYSLWVSRYNQSIKKYRSLLEAQLNLIGEEQYRIDNFGLPEVDVDEINE